MYSSIVVSIILFIKKVYYYYFKSVFLLKNMYNVMGEGVFWKTPLTIKQCIYKKALLIIKNDYC